MKIRNKRIAIAIGISIVLMGGSVLIQRALVNGKATVEVISTVNDIGVGDVIKESDLGTEKISLGDDSKYYVKNKSDLVGKIAKEKIYKDEKINVNILTTSDDPRFYNGKKRCFGIPVKYIDDQYSLSFRKGDFVDVIFTTKATVSDKSVNSEIIMKNAKVVGALDSSNNFIKDGDTNVVAKEIVFEANTDKILDVSNHTTQGTFKFVRVPNGEIK